MQKKISEQDLDVAAVDGKLSLMPLTALVVGSMIGGGVFNLPRDMSEGASPGAMLIGWGITGIGMLMLAFIYQRLANLRPDLDAGPYAYARAGFGPFVGFNSAWGYWMSAFLGNVAYAVAIFSALSYFAPPFGDGNTLPAIIGASAALWLVHFLILRGIRQAAFVNVVTTVAKLVPLMLFVLVAAVAFSWDRFTVNFWGLPQGGDLGIGPIMDQVRSTMLVTLWVFIGIEGASVYSARARRRSDVGTATIIGFAGALGIYVLVSMLATGVLGQKELAELKVPAMAGVLEALVGPWGATLISLGLVVSVGGAFLSWTLLCAEIPYACAKDGTFPAWFAAESASGAPVNALWFTNGAVQAFLLLSYFSSSAYSFFYSIASVAILPPYVLTGAFALKLALSGETRQAGSGRRRRDILVGLAATVYGVWLVYAAGLEYLLMCAVLFVPGILVYARARSEAGERILSGREGLLAAALVAAAVAAVWLMATGRITPF